jgi:hypothetical protein
MFEESNKSSMFTKSILFLFLLASWHGVCYAIVIPHGAITGPVDSGCEGNRDSTMA